MDKEDRRRYFIVGSVILEVVTPLFLQRLYNNYQNRGFPSLQAFLNSQPVKHTLFHLRNRNIWCCMDQQNCVNGQSLPLTHHQWNLLYSQGTSPTCRCRYCHCHFTANQFQLEDFDITLAGLILLNCCNLATAEEEAIRHLRQFKNDYLSHNTTGGITDIEYNSLWLDLTTNILKLDNSKADEVSRIQNRPLDESLCHKYCIQLLDIHKLLEKIDVTTQENNDLLHRNAEQLQELLWHVQNCKEHITWPYQLGHSIFKLHHQFDLRSVLHVGWINVTSGLMMDDGRLVVCIHGMYRLLTSNIDGSYQDIPPQYALSICATDGSQADIIPLPNPPWYVTAVNNSRVAISSLNSQYIEIYDINNKHKLKKIKLSGLCYGITTINNKLAVNSNEKLYILDHQSGEVEHTIIKEKCNSTHWFVCVHGNGDRIFYNDGTTDNIYCYNYAYKKHSVTLLPSKQKIITSLQDGSLYVACEGGSVLHVSDDGKQYKKVTKEGLESVKDYNVISYNQKQRKLFVCTETGVVKLFNET